MQVHRATSIQEAATMMAALGDGARLLAGGTDLLIQLRRGTLSCDHLVDIGRIAGLDAVTIDGEAVRIGALTRHRTVERHAGFVGSLQALIEPHASWAAGRSATWPRSAATSPTPRRRPTWCRCCWRWRPRSSSPARDTRHLPLSQFLLGPRRTAARRDEVLTAFRFVPPAGGYATAFLKAGRRKAMEISIVNVAALLAVDEAGRCHSARIALGAVGPTAFRATEAEACLQGRLPSDEAFEVAARAAVAASRPIDDVRASAAYRRHLVTRLTVRALRLCRERLQETT